MHTLAKTPDTYLGRAAAAAADREAKGVDPIEAVKPGYKESARAERFELEFEGGSVRTSSLHRKLDKRSASTFFKGIILLPPLPYSLLARCLQTKVWYIAGVVVRTAGPPSANGLVPLRCSRLVVLPLPDTGLSPRDVEQAGAYIRPMDRPTTRAPRSPKLFAYPPGRC